MHTWYTLVLTFFVTKKLIKSCDPTWTLVDHTGIDINSVESARRSPLFIGASVMNLYGVTVLNRQSR